ncbi:MAG TPA: hypothetical protein VET90_08850, partial [Candidatus Binatus sp.]|nr:hypothetical protein [Candidatus Binatus sp.]
RLQRADVVARRDGAGLFIALGLWALARFVVAFTWRDPPTVGPLRVDQVLSLLLVAVAVVGLAERARAPFRTTDWGETEPEPSAGH